MTPNDRQSAPSNMWPQGFTALKFDPAGAYSAFDPRQPSLEAMDLSEKFMRLLREAVGSRADLLFGTHGQFTASGAIRLAGG
jgi:L-alanine-DL-glutamate epimerase-like enolase superfamily enzyme